MAKIKHWMIPVFILVVLSYLPSSMHQTEELPASAPSHHFLKALKIMDAEFAFRSIGFYLQHLGDTQGQRQALVSYDYEALYHWFKAADDLKDQSDLMPCLALFYYGGTPMLKDQLLMKRFVKEHAIKHPYTKQKWFKLLRRPAHNFFP